MGKFMIFCFVLLFSSSFLLSFSSCDTKCDPPPRFIDLTHHFSNGIISWPNSQPFNMKISKQFIQIPGDRYWYQTENYSSSVHAGTHIDAPCHFYEKGWCVDKIPLDYLIAPAVVLDFSKKIGTNSSFVIKSDHIKAWEDKNCEKICSKSIVLIYTGWSEYWFDKQKYLGGSSQSLSFPGLSSEAAEWLIKERSIIGIGIDTASIDPGNSKDFKTHRVLSEKNIYILENVANMDFIVEKYTRLNLYVFPMKLIDTSGAPCRILAEKCTQSASHILRSSVRLISIILGMTLAFL